MRVAPVRIVHTVQALAKPWIPFWVILVSSHIDIALVVKSRQGNGLHHKGSNVIILSQHQHAWRENTIGGAEVLHASTDTSAVYLLDVCVAVYSLCSESPLWHQRTLRCSGFDGTAVLRCVVKLVARD